MRRAGPGARRKIPGSGQIEETFWVKRQGSLAGLGVDPRTDLGGSAGSESHLGGCGHSAAGGYGWPAGTEACSGGASCAVPHRARGVRAAAAGRAGSNSSVLVGTACSRPAGAACASFARGAAGSPQARRPVCSAWETGALWVFCPHPHLSRDFSSVLTFRISSALQLVEAKSFTF